MKSYVPCVFCNTEKTKSSCSICNVRFFTNGVFYQIDDEVLISIDTYREDHGGFMRIKTKRGSFKLDSVFELPPNEMIIRIKKLLPFL